MDKNFYTTRTVEGKLRTTHHHHNPQTFRNLCVPPLPEGFRRESIVFITAPNGLDMTYTIIDMAVHAAAPHPATEWECDHTTSIPSGVNLTESVHVMLKGPPDVDRTELITLGVGIVEKIVGEFPTLASNGKILKQFDIIDYKHDSKIEIRATLLNRKEVTKQLLRRVIGNLGQHLDGDAIGLDSYDHLKSPHPKNYGPDTPTGAFLMRWQEPCGDIGNHSIPEEANLVQQRLARDTNEIEPNVVLLEADIPEPLDTDVKIDGDHEDNPYTYYEISADYDTSDNKIAVPVASSVSSGGGSVTQKVLTLSRSTSRYVMTVRAERSNKAPVLPEPKAKINFASDNMLTLLDKKIVGMNPELLPDGNTFMFRLEAKYWYAFDKPPEDVNGELKLPASPWDTSKAGIGDHQIPGESFDSANNTAFTG